MKRALAAIGGGYGSVVAATPVIAALRAMDYSVDALVESRSYEAATLLSGWDALGTIYLARKDMVLREGARPYDAVVRTMGNVGGLLNVGPEFAPEMNTAEDDPSVPRTGRGPDRSRHIRRHRVELNLSALERLGWNGARPPCHVEFDAPISTLPERFAAVAPGVSRRRRHGARRRWPHWKTFCELLHERTGLEVVALGEEEHADPWMNDPTRPWMHTLCGMTSIREAAGAIARCKRLYAVDNGLGWIGAALGRPVVSLLGPTDEASGAPMGDGVTVVSSVAGCRPCEFTSRLAGCRKARCMAALSAESVLIAGMAEGARLAG